MPIGASSRLLLNQIHPFERRQLDGLEAAPWLVPVDDLGFVEAVDGLGQGIVVAIADATDRRLDAGLGQALGVFDRDVLHAPVGVVDEPAARSGRRS